MYCCICQGSVLGPLYFSIYINDIVEVIRYSQIYIFADDIKILNKIDTVDDCVKLQSDLTRLEKWCCLNNRESNKNKCKVLSFTLLHSFPQFDYHLGNYLLQRTTSIKDLGVHYDDKLSFK